MVEGPAQGAAVAADRAALMDMDMEPPELPEGPEAKGCTNSLWRREPGLWPCTTLSQCARTASLSTARFSYSARTIS